MKHLQCQTLSAEHVSHTTWSHCLKCMNNSVHCMSNFVIIILKWITAHQPCIQLQLQCSLWSQRINIVTTIMHIARDCAICSSTTCATNSAMSAVNAEESQRVWQLVSSVYWWISRAIRAVARHAHSLYWKEAISVSLVHREVVVVWGRRWWSANDARTLERSVFRDSHTLKIQ